jgi:hypothetical protein
MNLNYRIIEIIVRDDNKVELPIGEGFKIEERSKSWIGDALLNASPLLLLSIVFDVYYSYNINDFIANRESQVQSLQLIVGAINLLTVFLTWLAFKKHNWQLAEYLNTAYVFQTKEEAEEVKKRLEKANEQKQELKKATTKRH